MDLKVISQLPHLHLCSANTGHRRLVLCANMSDSAEPQIRSMNKNFLFFFFFWWEKENVIWKWENAMRLPGGDWMFLWQKAEKSESQRCNQFYSLRKSVKVKKMKRRRIGDFDAEDMKVFKTLHQNFPPSSVSHPRLITRHFTPLLESQTDVFLLTFTYI